MKDVHEDARSEKLQAPLSFFGGSKTFQQIRNMIKSLIQPSALIRPQ